MREEVERRIGWGYGYGAGYVDAVRGRPPRNVAPPDGRARDDAEAGPGAAMTDRREPVPLRSPGPRDEVHAHEHEWVEDGTCRFCPVHKPSMDAMRGLIAAIEREERKAEPPALLPPAPEYPLPWRWRLRRVAREASRRVRWHRIVLWGRWDAWRGRHG